ncbi:rab family small gtpase [Anaeramoeba ignava]|uniref:Rab family small gtpase n=1 Tax=Anaeramoeba ignava TaxID=1746090 RepID=A0A9Q0LSL2_ANAIG|nr:rab family small gtpase [Anaeramoeba ignava]
MDFNSFVNDNGEKETRVKIVIVGETNVGKTQFILRVCENTFNESPNATIGVDFKSKSIELNGNKFRVEIWDTAGQERYRSVAELSYRNSHGAFLVYDITHLNSIEKAKNWLQSLRKTLPDIAIMAIGNKIDLEEKRQVSLEQGHQFSKENNLLFMETSAKTGENVNDSFYSLLRKILDLKEEPFKNIKTNINLNKSQTPSINLNNSIKKSKKCC